MKTSLIIATYNWAAALRLCLASVERQTVMPDEVLIADDGSGRETRKVIEEFATRMPIVHVWHEDKGFRLSRIRNKAIARSTGDYVIQIDGDIILDRHYVEDILSEARAGYYTCGSRAKLSEGLTRRILGLWNFTPHFYTWGVRRRQNVIRIPWLTPLFYGYDHGRGCNMSFWRTDLLAVNGYDERIEGYGLEDTDLSDRLERLGVRKRFIKFKGIQYHIHHDERSRGGKKVFRYVLESNREQGRIAVEQGIFSSDKSQVTS